MSSELHGLRTVIYPTSDLANAKAWWTEFLGFGPYFDEPFYVGYNVAGYELGLMPSEDPSAGPTTYWAVDDVAQSIGAALSQGATEREAPQDVGDGIIVASMVTPLGQVVGLIYNPHFVAGT
jgi:catechol 2,3-dioxygenase-like lactoylglutathione lyase family enzyme